MKALHTSLLLSALLCPMASTAFETKGIHEPIRLTNPDRGEVQQVGFYTCPKNRECAVTIIVQLVDEARKECRFALIGDDMKEFFYIDRRKDPDDQAVIWTLASATPDWTAEFTTDRTKSRGINFGEGGDKDHVDNPTIESERVHKRKINSNKNGKLRRSILLYDIDVTLRNGPKSIPCSYGPGIINRG